MQQPRRRRFSPRRLAAMLCGRRLRAPAGRASRFQARRGASAAPVRAAAGAAAPPARPPAGAAGARGAAAWPPAGLVCHSGLGAGQRERLRPGAGLPGGSIAPWLRLRPAAVLENRQSGRISGDSAEPQRGRGGEGGLGFAPSSRGLG